MDRASMRFNFDATTGFAFKDLTLFVNDRTNVKKRTIKPIFPMLIRYMNDMGA